MTIKRIAAVLGGSAKLVTGASNVAVLVGALYLVDCRITAKGVDAVDRCYFTALPLMGVGIAGRGGFQAGYNTFNPALHKDDDKPTTTRRTTRS